MAAHVIMARASLHHRPAIIPRRRNNTAPLDCSSQGCGASLYLGALRLLCLLLAARQRNSTPWHMLGMGTMRALVVGKGAETCKHAAWVGLPIPPPQTPPHPTQPTPRFFLPLSNLRHGPQAVVQLEACTCYCRLAVATPSPAHAKGGRGILEHRECRLRPATLFHCLLGVLHHLATLPALKHHSANRSLAHLHAQVEPGTHEW